MDDAFRLDMMTRSVGVFVHDENGKCVAAFSQHLPDISSAMQVEIEASRVGLLITIHEGWAELQLESDCASLISALACSNVDFS